MDETPYFNKTLHAIRQLHRLALVSESKEQMIGKAFRLAVENMECCSAWIALLNDDGTAATFVDSIDGGPSFPAMQDRLHKGEFPSCIAQINARRNDSMIRAPHSECSGCPLASNDGGRQSLICPLVRNDRVLGFLYVSTPAAIQSEKQDLFYELSQNILLAIDNFEAVAQNRYFSQIVNTLPEFIAIVSSDYRYSAVNQFYRTAYGVSEEKIIGEPVAKFVGESIFNAEIKPRLDRCLAGETLDFQIKVTLPTQKRCWMQMHYIPYLNAEGRIDGVIAHGHDISEQKNNEDSLNKLFSHATNLEIIVDFNGRIQRAGSGIKTILGCSENELLGSAFLDLVHPDDKAATLEKMEMLARGESVYSFENRCRHESGAYRDLLWSANASSDQQLVYADAKDITERRAAENALCESESKLKNAQRIAKIGDWTWNIATNEVEWSDQVYDIFLAPREKPTFEFAKSFVHSEDQGLWQHTISHAASQRIPFSLDYRAIRSDGKVIWVHNETETVYNEKGHFLGYKGTVQDITTRKLDQIALWENKQKYKSMVENIGIGVFLVDEKMELVETNSKIFEMFPKASTAFKGRRCHEIFKNDLCKKFCDDCPASKTLKDGLPNECIHKSDNPNSENSYRILSSPVKNDQNKITGAIVMIENISAVIDLERKLQQSQKLESIGTLAGGIAHDFNNLLSSIIGFTELSMDAVEKGTVMEDNLQEVYAASKRAKKLVQQILTYARQSEEETGPIQPAPITKEALKFLRSTIPSSVIIRPTIESEASIVGNVTQFHQIVLNLCTNAAHAMEENGGDLVITLKDRKVDGGRDPENPDLPPGDYLELKVSDTGTGIPTNMRDIIFEPYFTTKEKGEGTGMGLAIVQGIVDKNNGSISVDSIPGEGTTITIVFPAIETQKSFEMESLADLPTGTERILVVDDEASIVKVNNQILGELGYSITSTTDCKQALHLFQSQPDDYDLVITDMTMPIMNGGRLAMEMLSIRPDIPIILCTGYNKKVSEESAKEIGIKAFLYKPIEKCSLAKTVRRVLDGRENLEKE